MGVDGQRHAPAALPPGKTRYPLYRRLGGPQGRSGLVRKISPAPGFDPRTAQPVASRYTEETVVTYFESPSSTTVSFHIHSTSVFTNQPIIRPWSRGELSYLAPLLQRRMIGWLVNTEVEWMWKETVVEDGDSK